MEVIEHEEVMHRANGDRMSLPFLAVVMNRGIAEGPVGEQHLGGRG